MKSIEGKVSAYNLNLAKSMNWKIIQKPFIMKVYQDEVEDSIIVKKTKQNILTCECYFSKSMGIPYEHIIACLVPGFFLSLKLIEFKANFA